MVSAIVGKYDFIHKTGSTITAQQEKNRAMAIVNTVANGVFLCKRSDKLMLRVCQG